MIKVNGQEIEFTKFPNGETNMNHLSFPDLEEGYATSIEFKYVQDGDLIRLMFVREYIREHGIGEHPVYLTVYYMPYSRMDRSVDNSPFTLEYVANFINSLGFDLVKINEPHSDVALDLVWNSSQRLITKELLPKVLKEINFDLDRDYILFPDEGSKLRYESVGVPNLLIGEKKRNFDTGRIESLDIAGDVKEGVKKALIVDDLCSYGGTFCRSADKLREMGFEEVYLLVAHSENSIFEGNLFNHVDKVFTTDSILAVEDYCVSFNDVKIDVDDSSLLKVYKMEGLLHGN